MNTILTEELAQKLILSFNNDYKVIVNGRTYTQIDRYDAQYFVFGDPNSSYGDCHLIKIGDCLDLTIFKYVNVNNDFGIC